ncbi:MAG TPA: Tox-REase-5 domain-containing protein [Myxococcaceae bacterium]|nr:Tox-REase-5 domain-containing protein [Myxococcaceae bacterium]
MSRFRLPRLMVALSLVFAGCATLDEQVVSPPGPERTVTVRVPRRTDRPRIPISESELYVSMRPVLGDLKYPAELSFFTQPRPNLRFTWAAAEGGPFQLQLVQGYHAWCQRKRGGIPGDCLEVQDGRAWLDDRARYKIAFDIALGQQWEGFQSEFATLVDPRVLRVAVLGAMVSYMVLISVPEPFTKVAAIVATALLTAYLGADALWNLVGGWLELVRAADAARSFEQLQAAGERYGRRVGAQTARVLIMVVTTVLTHGGATAHFTSLPGAARAASLFAADNGQGLGLSAAWSANSATVGVGGIVFEVAPGALLSANAGVGVLGVAMSSGGGPGKLQSGQAQPGAPGEKEPGEWRKAKSPPQGRSAKYQQQVTGRPPDEAYMVNGVEFDGYVPRNGSLVHVEDLQGVLLDAKGKGYEKFFLENLKPKPWFADSGALKLIEQAGRQQRAVMTPGIRIQWHVAEEKAANAIRLLLEDAGVTKVEVIYTPMR